MSDKKANSKIDFDTLFYGSVTLGERGQIVIPADARKQCEINPGDKLLVFRHPLHPSMLMLSKIGDMQEMLGQLSTTIEKVGKE
ncbi:MAG: AbrB/MazE/SpoVT family DNA-binding domain-containing protein [bacterium]